MTDRQQITELLQSWQDGDAAALETLSVTVYDELKRLARSAFSGERAGHTLQPTALVNEAFAKLVNVEVSWQDRAHFYALSARMMRRILVNHAQAKNAQKRGSAEAPVTLDEQLVGEVSKDRRIEDINDALEALASVDERKANLIELQIFGGLTFEEMSEVTGLSTSTLDRELRMAKAWLKQEISKNI